MMKFDRIISGGTLVTPQESYCGDIGILDGKIAAILAPNSHCEGAETLDATGKYVLPGIIDAHVHFRDPGLTHKENFETGSRSAAMGGVTTVIDMPNVLPVCSTVEAFQQKELEIAAKAYVDYGLFAVLTEDNINQMEGLAALGVSGYKIYLGTSVGNIKAATDGILLEQLTKAAELGIRTGFHAENNAINDYFTQKLMTSGCINPDCMPDARPYVSESVAIAMAIAYASYTGARIHIYHVSSGKSVEIIRTAKAHGIDVTAETCPQYLLLNREDYHRLGVNMKVFPPIREATDQNALWTGLLDGTLDMIATDHAPHSPAEKKGNIWQAAAGVVGVEIAVPLMLTQVNEGRLTLNQYVRMVCERPAKIWGLYPRKGTLLVGADADLTIVDMRQDGIIENEKLNSLSTESAFDQTRTSAAPWATIVRGQTVMLQGQLCGKKGWGHRISSIAYV